VDPGFVGPEVCTILGVIFKKKYKIRYEIEYLFRAPGQVRDPETLAS
jgi:hypothetical protein